MVKLIGIGLLVLGLIGLVYGGITYTKNSDTIDLGIAEIEVQEKDRLSIHPAIGGVMALAGAGLLVAGKRK